MALFLTPIPDDVLHELERRAKILGDSASGTKIDLRNNLGGSGEKWKFARQPWVRAASLAVLRPTYSEEFLDKVKQFEKDFDKMMEEELTLNPESKIEHPMKHYHRKKNVLYGGYLLDIGGGAPLDPTRYSNLLDDFAQYNQGIDGAFGKFASKKLEGYKSMSTPIGNIAGGPNDSRPGVPNPGIINLNVENVGSFGSMKKIDMEVECHDFAQLQMIESLYMTPGTTIILEWGWTCDTKGNNIDTAYMVNLDNESVLKNTPQLHEQIKSRTRRANHSYEGAIGTVTNYTWSAKDNGSFTCKISLRSRGEAFLGQQVDAEHSPLARCLGSLTTRFVSSGLSAETKEELGDDKNFQTSGLLEPNRAQLHLDAQLGTITNTYYPSFNVLKSPPGDSKSGKDDPMKTFGNLDFGGMVQGKPGSIGAFPRFFYKYKETQANQKRQQLADKAKNSVIQGNKSATQQKNLMKQVAIDTIREYVATIVQPAVTNHQRTKGISNGYADGTKFDPEWTPTGGGGSLTNKDMKVIKNFGFSVDGGYGKMLGHPWYRGFKMFNVDLPHRGDGNKNVYGFWYPASKPWKPYAQEPRTMDYKWTENQKKLADSQLRWTGLKNGDAAANVSMVYRPYFEVGKPDDKQSHMLLFGSYFPMGNGGDWGQFWNTDLSDPFQGNNKSSKGLQVAFYKYYNMIYIGHWENSKGNKGQGISTDKIDASSADWKTTKQSVCPLSAVVSANYVGYKSGKSAKRGGIPKWQRMIARGNQLGYINPRSPLKILGNTIQNACVTAGSAKTLGMEAGFLRDVTDYIKKEYGKIPTSSDIQRFIMGYIPGTSGNAFGNGRNITTAQTCWQSLTMAVGSGQFRDHATKASYGLPHELTAGNVGRAFGAIHVTHPLDVHARAWTGVNIHGLTTGAGYGSADKNFGLYYPTGNSSGQGDNWFSNATRSDTHVITPRIRRLNSGHTSQLMDYPMPMWGHYSAVNSNGEFRFVKEIEDNKKKFRRDLLRKKKNAANAMNQAFADAYAIYEEHRMITDGDIYVPFAVLEKIINDCQALEKDGALVTRFDSGQHPLAGAGKLPEGADSQYGAYAPEYTENNDDNSFIKAINLYNDSDFQNVLFEMGEDGAPTTTYPAATTVGIHPIKSRAIEHAEEKAKDVGEEEEAASEEPSPGEIEYGFNNGSMDHATYYHVDVFGIKQIVSLPSKICNHKFLCSTDPRICLLPGQTGVAEYTTSGAEEDYENAPVFIGDDAENEKLEGLKFFKRFTDDPDRKYGFLPNILVNTDFILKCYDQSTTLKDMMQKVLDGMSAACGNIWNFKFQIDGANSSGTTRIVDANFSASKLDICAEFPVMRTDSMVRGYSLESKIPNAMAVMALYGNNTPNPDGEIENKLFELGNMFVDLAHENIQLPKAENEATAAKDEEKPVPNSTNGRVQALVHLLTHHIHDNLNEEHIIKAGKILKTILHDRTASGPGENALLDHNIIPLKMSFELDGISGIHFGHALTATHLPQRYKDNICFQVTNVKHSIKAGDWTTSVEAVMRRRPMDMGVYTIGSSPGNQYDPNFIRKLTKEQLNFTRNSIAWNLNDTEVQLAEAEARMAELRNNYVDKEPDVNLEGGGAA